MAHAFAHPGYLGGLAIRRDRAAGRHRTERFLRLRPLAERGSLAGTTPLAPVLAGAAARAA